MKKSDIEKLVGILEEFDQDAISEAYKEIENGKEASLTFSNTETMDTEVISEDNNVFHLEDMPAIERIIDENNLLPAYFLEEGAVNAKSVAKVRVISRGWTGTGFLISPTILLTNNHVLGSINDARGTKIQFNYQKRPDGTNATIDEYTTDPDSLFYTNSSLDFTIVRVAKHCNFVMQPSYHASEEYLNEYTPNPLNPSIPRIDDPRIKPDLDWRWRRPPLRWCTSAGSKWGYIKLHSSPAYAVDQLVNVIQHPKGREKEVALHENKITNIYTNVIRYKTDTQRGSSGSPVFDNSWKLVALHHAAGEHIDGEWLSNEGIRVDKIVQDLRSKYTGTPTGQQILTELGI